MKNQFNFLRYHFYVPHFKKLNKKYLFQDLNQCKLLLINNDILSLRGAFGFNEKYFFTIQLGILKLLNISLEIRMSSELQKINYPQALFIKPQITKSPGIIQLFQILFWQSFFLVLHWSKFSIGLALIENFDLLFFLVIFGNLELSLLVSDERNLQFSV